MKSYSKDEIKKARSETPPPLQRFVLSQVLASIYAGIQQKHSLNLRQIWAVSELTNVTLVGLETESAFEANLHQLLPELPNALAHELVADINVRIFKEARRRIAENILEPETENALGVSPEESERLAEERRLNNLEDDDPEILALIEKERREEEQRLAESPLVPNEPTLEESELEDDTEEDADLAELDELDKNPDHPSAQTESEKEYALLVAKAESEDAQDLKKDGPQDPPAQRAIVPPLQVPPPAPQGPSVVSQKLAAPVTTRVEGGDQKPSPIFNGVQEIKKIAPPVPRLKGDSDPYREPAE